MNETHKKRKTRYDNLIQKLLESYRTTYSGHRVAWDEPGESDDNPDVIRHNAYLARRRKTREQAQNRLKSKGLVPKKEGKPMFEDLESPSASLLQLFIMFQKSYQSNRRMTFREWSRELAQMLDSLG